MSIIRNSPKKKAIAYYRHSAEDKQENSVPIQREHAQKFASQYNIEIIHEEADEGKSGLLAKRPGFEKLFNNWIENNDAPLFDYVIVFDVSRWGRFQNQNEAAHYEYRCEQKGKKVIYISRGFPKEDQKLASSLITSVDRYMAAEYSRVLSDKVFHGCVKVSEQGYSAGGTACYGMARLLLDANKQPVRILRRGEHKSIDNERVSFIPIGDKTTETVKEIFSLLVNKDKNLKDIAEDLNIRKIPSPNGFKWDKSKLLRILTNEAYIGTRIYNKTSNKLKQGHKKNPRSEWIFASNAFEALVDPEIFYKAQEKIYWAMPKRWKQGISAIIRAKRLIEKEVKTLLANQGFSEDDIFFVIRELPMTFGVTLQKLPYWCFVITERFRRYHFALGIGVIMDNIEPVDKFFTIPINDFGLGGFKIFSEKDQEFNNYWLKEDDLENKIINLAKEHIQYENRRT